MSVKGRGQWSAEEFVESARIDYRGNVEHCGRVLAQSRHDEAEALEAVRLAVLDAIAHGVTEAEAARLGQVDRMTVRKWRGKR